MRRRSVLVGGAALGAVACYVGATVLGGLLDPSYSHVSDSVSELTSTGAPNRVLLGLLYGAYNVGVGAMVVGLWRSSRRTRSVRVGLGLLSAVAAMGVLMIEPFPQDPMGTAITTTGTVHIALASVSSLALVVAAFVLARGWRHDPRWRGLARVSLGAGIALVLLAPPGFWAAATGSPYFGLAERVVQAVFLGWFAVIGTYALGRERASRAAESDDDLPELSLISNRWHQ
jgi:hypothetical protein